MLCCVPLCYKEERRYFVLSCSPFPSKWVKMHYKDGLPMETVSAQVLWIHWMGSFNRGNTSFWDFGVLFSLCHAWFIVVCYLMRIEPWDTSFKKQIWSIVNTRWHQSFLRQDDLILCYLGKFLLYRDMLITPTHLCCLNSPKGITVEYIPTDLMDRATAHW